VQGDRLGAAEERQGRRRHAGAAADRGSCHEFAEDETWPLPGAGASSLLTTAPFSEGRSFLPGSLVDEAVARHRDSA
jgi:hypothetical protein